MFPPLALVPLVLSKFLADHVNGQLRHLLLVVSMLDGGSLASHSSQHAGRCSFTVPSCKRSHCGCFGRPGAQGSAISAFNPLAAQRCVLHRQVFSSSVSGSGRGNSNVYIKGLPAVLDGVGWVVCLTNNALSAPKLANFLLHLFQVGLAWHTIGIYHSALSAFLEPHCILKASNHPVILKLMHHFYLQSPPSHKWFDPWDVEHLLSLLESWAPASSLTTFKLAWKTATPLALVTAKHCSDLTLLCVDNQHLFLQHHAAIFVPLSGGKTDHLGHLPPQIHIESHCNVNLCPVFYLKAYLRHTESFRKQSYRSQVISLFLGNNRQHWPVCAKTISSWVQTVLSIAKAHMSLGSLWGVAASAALVAGVSGDHPAGR